MDLDRTGGALHCSYNLMYWNSMLCIHSFILLFSCVFITSTFPSACLWCWQNDILNHIKKRKRINEIKNRRGRYCLCAKNGSF